MDLASKPSRFGVAAIFVVMLAGTAACGGGAKTATPSELVAGAATYDGTAVSVSGTAKDPHARKTRRGQILLYKLCDENCINVVQFGEAAAVEDGASVSVTGTFHQSFGRIRKTDDVLVVGGRRPGS